MKRLILLGLAIFVPFAALVAYGLSRLDAPPPPAPVVVAPAPAEPMAAPPAPSLVANALRAAAPPAPEGRPAEPAAAVNPVEAQAGQIAQRPRMIAGLPSAQGVVLMAPPIARGRPQVVPTVMKNGFPPNVAAAAKVLTAHCWADMKGRAPGPVQVTVLAQPTSEGHFDKTRVSWSSWSDPLFMACVEDAIAEGSFPTGEPLPPAPVIHTLEFGDQR